MIKIRFGSTMSTMETVDKKFNRKNIEQEAARFGRVIKVEKVAKMIRVTYDDFFSLVFQEVTVEQKVENKKAAIEKTVAFYEPTSKKQLSLF